MTADRRRESRPAAITNPKSPATLRDTPPATCMMRPVSRSGTPPRITVPELSIIIPTLNEAAVIGETLRALHESLGDDASSTDIIIADGGSDDDTPAIARSLGARVIDAPRGRGPQQNAGALAASAGVLLFLHADTRLPAGFAPVVSRTLAARGVAAGAFSLAIDAPGRSLRVIEALANGRSRLLRQPWGDQAIFTRAGTFREAGGFPDWPLMEDVALVRRLRRRGRIELLSLAATTSARRWTTRGVWRTTLLNQACLAAYTLGVPPHRIARWRRTDSNNNRNRRPATRETTTPATRELKATNPATRKTTESVAQASRV